MLSKRTWVILKGSSFIWNYLLCVLIYYYFTLSFLLDFELHGYWRKKILKSFPPSADLALDNIYIYILWYVQNFGITLSRTYDVIFLKYDLFSHVSSKNSVTNVWRMSWPFTSLEVLLVMWTQFGTTKR